MQEVFDFLESCGHFFIATTDGDQPKLRPFETICIFEGRLYIQTGKKKAVSRQLAANPKVELCAFDGKTWIRITATAVEDDRREARVFMLDKHPDLKAIYDPDDGNTEVLYLKDAKASFYGNPVTVTKVVEF